MIYTLALPFKGERDYVSATSVFDSILSLRSTCSNSLTDIDFSMRRFTHNNVCLVVNDDEIYKDEALIGGYRDSSGTITVLERAERITERAAYNESYILNQCGIHENTIYIPQNIDTFTFIEKIIAAYKALLQYIFNEPDCFFFFIRITIHHIPSIDFQIHFDRIISGKYFQGSITTKHEKLGMIYFGVK